MTEMDHIKARVVNNYAFILENVSDVDTLLDRLFSKLLINLYDKDYVKKGSENGTKRACLERLFECLFIKDNAAVWDWEKFVQSLEECGDGHVLEELQKTSPKDIEKTNHSMEEKIGDIKATFLRQPSVTIHQHFYGTEDTGRNPSSIPTADVLRNLGNLASVNTTSDESYVQVMESNVRLLLDVVVQQEEDAEDLKTMANELEKKASLILVGSDKDNRSRLSKLLLKYFSKQNYSYRPLILQKTDDWEKVKSKMKEHVVLLEDIVGDDAVNMIKATSWSKVLPDLPLELLKSQCPLIISLSTSLYAKIKNGQFKHMFEGLPVYQLKGRKRRATAKDSPVHEVKPIVRSLSQSSGVAQSQLHLACFRGDAGAVQQLMDEDGAIAELNHAGQTPLQVACGQQHADIVSLLLGIEETALLQYADMGAMNVDRMLLNAATIGHAGVVQELLKQGADKETTDKEGRVALHLASLRGHSEVVDVLMAHPSSLDRQDKDGRTALHYACLEGHEDIVKALLAAKAATDLTDRNGFTPLHCASSQNRVNIISFLLLNEKIDVDQVTAMKRQTSVHDAKDNKQADAITKVDPCTVTGCTALHVAAGHGNLDVVKLLVSKEADVNACDNEGITPLHTASIGNHNHVVQHLLKFGAEIDKADINGQSALHHACRAGSAAAVAVLAKHGANCSLFDKNLNTPAHAACEAGHPSALQAMFTQVTITPARDKRAIIEMTANNSVVISIPNREKDTPLHCACRSGQILAVWLLISKGALNEYANNEGNTPLHEACKHDHAGIVQTLLGMNVQTTLSNARGFTPLHIAASNGHLLIARMLILSGADLEAKDCFHRTPVQLASENGHFELVKLLAESKCDINAADNGGNTSLHSASQKGDVNTVNVLLHHAANPNTVSKNEQSALVVASIFGHTAVVQTLLQCKSHTLLPDQGWAALKAACVFGHIGIVESLLKNGACITTETHTTPEPLYQAILFGHVTIAHLLLQECETSQLQLTSTKCGTSSFHLACHKGQTSLVKRMICKILDVNITDDNGMTALMVASISGNTETLNALLNAGANPKLVDKNSLSALHIASQRGFEKGVELLLNAGADANIATLTGETALHLAAVQGHDECVEQLIKAGSDVNKASHTNTPLGLAIISGNENSVRLLIQAGVEVKKPSATEIFPIHIASFLGNGGILRLLLTANVDANAVGLCGKTPLSYACASGKLDVIEALLKHGARIDVLDMFNEAPLTAACATGRTDVVKMMLDHKGDDCLIVQNPSIMNAACASGNLEIVKMLEQHGCDLRGHSNGNSTPVHFASGAGNVELVRYLLSKGADANTEDERGRTPLFIACSRGYNDIVLLLLNHGADHDADSIEEATPLHVACANGHAACVETLLKHRASVTAKDKYGWTPLHVACRKGHENIAKLLTESEYDTNLEEQDLEGNTSLLFSCAFGYVQLTELLLERGARVDVKNKMGQTALDMACQSCCIDCVILLLNTKHFEDCKLVFLVPNMSFPSPSSS